VNKNDISGVQEYWMEDSVQAPIQISDLNIEDLEKRSEEFAKSNI
jgi:hypothetical protein